MSCEENGMPIKVLDGFSFRKDKDLMFGGTAWRCCTRYCQARLHTDFNGLILDSKSQLDHDKEAHNRPQSNLPIWESNSDPLAIESASTCPPGGFSITELCGIGRPTRPTGYSDVFGLAQNSSARSILCTAPNRKAMTNDEGRLITNVESSTSQLTTIVESALAPPKMNDLIFNYDSGDDDVVLIESPSGDPLQEFPKPMGVQKVHRTGGNVPRPKRLPSHSNGLKRKKANPSGLIHEGTNTRSRDAFSRPNKPNTKCDIGIGTDGVEHWKDALLSRDLSMAHTCLSAILGNISFSERYQLAQLMAASLQEIEQVTIGKKVPSRKSICDKYELPRFKPQTSVISSAKPVSLKGPVINLGETFGFDKPNIKKEPASPKVLKYPDLPKSELSFDSVASGIGAKPPTLSVPPSFNTSHIKKRRGPRPARLVWIDRSSSEFELLCPGCHKLLNNAKSCHPCIVLVSKINSAQRRGIPIPQCQHYQMSGGPRCRSCRYLRFTKFLESRNGGKKSLLENLDEQTRICDYCYQDMNPAFDKCDSCLSLVANVLEEIKQGGLTPSCDHEHFSGLPTCKSCRFHRCYGEQIEKQNLPTCPACKKLKTIDGVCVSCNEFGTKILQGLNKGEPAPECGHKFREGAPACPGCRFRLWDEETTDDRNGKAESSQDDHSGSLHDGDENLQECHDGSQNDPDDISYPGSPGAQSKDTYDDTLQCPDDQSQNDCNGMYQDSSDEISRNGLCENPQQDGPYDDTLQCPDDQSQNDCNGMYQDSSDEISRNGLCENPQQDGPYGQSHDNAIFQDGFHVNPLGAQIVRVDNPENDAEMDVDANSDAHPPSPVVLQAL